MLGRWPCCSHFPACLAAGSTLFSRSLSGRICTVRLPNERACARDVEFALRFFALFFIRSVVPWSYLTGHSSSTA